MTSGRLKCDGMIYKGSFKFSNNFIHCVMFLYCCAINVIAALGVTGGNESLKHLFLFLLASSLDSLAANVKVILEVAFVK